MTRFTRLPTWAQALLTLAAVLLVISLLPMLASGTDSEDSEPTSSRSSDAPPSPLPLDRERRDGDRENGENGKNKDAQGRDVASDGDATPRGPLPVAGGSTLPALAAGIALLGGGLGLVRKVGLHGERGWPGRYVRRIG